MPAPKRIDRPVSKHLHLPESLVTQVELELYSELEGRVPKGAWQALVERLLREHLQAVHRGYKPTGDAA